MAAPVLHKQALPAVAVRVTEPPAQNEVEPLIEILAVGKAFTVTVVGDEAVKQPLTLVTVTLYVPPILTVIACVIAPLLHSQDAPAPAVKLTEPPAQIVVEPTLVILPTGAAFTVTVVGVDVTVQPPIPVTDTV